MKAERPCGFKTNPPRFSLATQRSNARGSIASHTLDGFRAATAVASVKIASTNSPLGPCAVVKRTGSERSDARAPGPANAA